MAWLELQYRQGCVPALDAHQEAKDQEAYVPALKRLPSRRLCGLLLQ
jgi:hypothetical protein